MIGQRITPDQCSKIDLAGKDARKRGNTGAQNVIWPNGPIGDKQAPGLNQTTRCEDADGHPAPSIAANPREKDSNREQEDAERSS